jgi:hypothetical protein
LSDGSVDREWLKEETVDPLTACEDWHDEHGDRWDDVRDGEYGDNRRGGANFGNSLIYYKRLLKLLKQLK